MKCLDINLGQKRVNNMALNQISLRAKFVKNVSFKEFNEECWIVAEMYWSFLRKYNTGDVKKCIISVTKKILEEDQYVLYTGIREVFLAINFKEYFNSDKIQKNSIQLELIHKGMMMIAECEGWETDPLFDAYNACLTAGLEYKFFVNDNLKTSPDRKRKAGLWCEWDIHSFKLFWILFDKNAVELKRDIIVSLEPSRGEIVYYLKWKWHDNETICVEDKYKYGTAKIWFINIPLN